jgi:hypothetical protein
MTYAYTQPIEILLSAQGADDVAYSVMASMTAAVFEPCYPDLKINLVISDQHILRLDLEEIAHGSYRLAAVVHEGSREQEFDVVSGNIYSAEFTEKLTLSAQAARITLGKMVEKDDAGVMPIGVILLAWITQANNKL